MDTRDGFSLDAKYRREEGAIFLSGIQALVRLPLDQHRADRRRGLNTATIISFRMDPIWTRCSKNKLYLTNCSHSLEI